MSSRVGFLDDSTGIEQLDFAQFVKNFADFEKKLDFRQLGLYIVIWQA